jgi:formate dehydrogenase iron-sulfur subunit
VTALAEPTGAPAAWPDTYGDEAKLRVGFFTDTTVCIGCKACEVACKEWNLIPEDGLVWTGESYDNTSNLGANSWRHVAFVEQRKPLKLDGETAALDGGGPEPLRWLMESDVCKHCTHAGCLDVCPTGALFRTEFGTVVVQEDVCNGCGYCVAACPFGVIGRREIPGPAHGAAQKCTLCYDRLRVGEQPACAKACPTESIHFGKIDELKVIAENRLHEVRSEGVEGARLYGLDESNGVGGTGAFFLLLDQPEVYGLPSDPVTPTRHLGQSWRAAAAAAGAMVVAVAAAAFAGRRL